MWDSQYGKLVRSEQEDRRGSSAKQVTNIANAARLRPPKTRRRSHRLTIGGAVLATKNSCNQPLSVSCARLHGDACRLQVVELRRNSNLVTMRPKIGLVHQAQKLFQITKGCQTGRSIRDTYAQTSPLPLRVVKALAVVLLGSL